MGSIIKVILLSIVYIFIAYHFFTKVLYPTFFPQEQDLVNDFACFYTASKFVLAGELPYRSTDNYKWTILKRAEAQSWQMNKNEVPAYIYPSLLAVTLTPLAHLPFPEARSIWAVILLFLFIGSIILTFWLLEKKPEWDGMTLLLFLIFLTSTSTMENFTLGHVNILLLFLLLLTLYSYQRGNSLLSGAMLAVATMLKSHPIVLILFFIWKKDVRAIASFIAVCILIFGLMQWAAPGADLFYAKNVVPAVSTKAPELNDKSLTICWRYLFTKNDVTPAITESPMLSKTLSFTTNLAVIVVAYLSLRRAKMRGLMNDKKESLLVFALALVCMLLVQPYFEIHHIIFAFLALGCIFKFYVEEHFNWKNITLLAILFLLLNSRGENSFEKIGHVWYSAFLSNPQIYGMLIVFSLMLIIINGKILKRL